MSTEALQWFKSTYSGDEGGECLEVAHTDDTVHIRDSKTPDGPTFQVNATAWEAFVTNA